MKVDQKAKTIVHVILTEDGIPRWFGPEPVAGSEPLDIEELRPLLPATAPADALAVAWHDRLITHCRVGGLWQPRPPAPGVEADATAPEATTPVEETTPVDSTSA